MSTDSTISKVARRWSRALLVLLLPLVVASNLGSLDRRFDLLSNLPVQFLWASCIVTIGLLVGRSWKFAAAGALCAAACAWHVLPWYLPQRLTPAAVAATSNASTARFRVMLHNVWQPNTRYDEMIAQTRDMNPDLVVFQEVDERWFARLAPLKDEYTYVFHSPGGRLRGMAIFSRLPLSDIREVVFNNPLSPSIVCDVTVGERSIALVCTHPWPPIGEEMTSSRNEQMRLTGEFARRLQERGPGNRPVMIIGDLNTGMWSPHYRELERLSGLWNVRRGFGIVATHPMNEPLYPRVPIDHVLVSEGIAVEAVFRGGSCGSDHAALIADLAISG